jgi:hypothetical protein
MAADPLDALRLTLMQEVLPMGLAVVERARKGGPREVLAIFEGNPGDSLERLRQEGEPVASQLRDTLDRFQPGLGNPVMKVEVRNVETPAAVATPASVDTDDTEELHSSLERIAARLAVLERRLG